jgi:bacteriocin-like protein
MAAKSKKHEKHEKKQSGKEKINKKDLNKIQGGTTGFQFNTSSPDDKSRKLG